MALSTALWTWILIGLVFAVLEMSVPFFGLIFATTSAFLAGSAGALGLGVPAQATVFTAALVVQLALLRPRIVRRLEGRVHPLPSRAQALVGTRGKVIQLEAEETGQHARASFSGDDWAVQSQDELTIGQDVIAIATNGIIINVRRA